MANQRVLISLLTDTLAVNQERATQILEELTDIGNIVLATDTTCGPEYLKEVLYEASRQQSILAQRSQEVASATRVVKREINEKTMAFNLLKNEKLATAPHIVRLASAKDREARAEYDLRVEKEELDTLKTELEDLLALERILKDKKTALKGLNADIKQQKQLMTDDNPYGQDLPTGSSRKGKNLTRVPYGQSYASKPLSAYPATPEGLTDDVAQVFDGEDSLESAVDDDPKITKVNAAPPEEHADYDEFFELSSDEDKKRTDAEFYNEALSFL